MVYVGMMDGFIVLDEDEMNSNHSKFPKPIALTLCRIGSQRNCRKASVVYKLKLFTGVSIRTLTNVVGQHLRMNSLTLTACLLVTLGVAFANPAVRESRHAVPIGMVDGMVLMDDDMVNDDSHIQETAFNPIMINPRNIGAMAHIASDQQTEEQRYGWGGGRPYGGGWGGGYGRPYGGGWGGGYGRPYGGGWGRPYGGGWGRPYYGGRW